VVDLSALIRRESGLDDPLLLRVLRLLLSFAKTLSDSLRSILDPSITVMMLYFFVGIFLDDVSTILITVPVTLPLISSIG